MQRLTMRHAPWALLPSPPEAPRKCRKSGCEPHALINQAGANCRESPRITRTCMRLRSWTANERLQRHTENIPELRPEKPHLHACPNGHYISRPPSRRSRCDHRAPEILAAWPPPKEEDHVESTARTPETTATIALLAEYGPILIRRPPAHSRHHAEVSQGPMILTRSVAGGILRQDMNAMHQNASVQVNMYMYWMLQAVKIQPPEPRSMQAQEVQVH
mmetsp:Transcript_9626/g.27092  ORF Transcript_9626/g.27092 Transcript_9626/m.27092 type:complete len:218 (-) Transcript_9626:21-674(-)